MKNKILILCAVFVLIGGGYALYHYHSQTSDAETSEVPKTAAHTEGKVHMEVTTITPEAATSSGIEVAMVGPATIRETASLNGRIVLNENRTTQIKARFPGIVRAVGKNIGDTVQKGDMLAKVEGNDSLIVYAVKAPISGTVLARATNVGDVAAADVPMFVISDLSELWGELFVFPRDAGRVQRGQTLRVHTTDGSRQIDSIILSLLPQAEASSQTVVARVTLPNAESVWRAGMSVRADVVLSERQVPLAVASAAVQRLENQTVVFVREEGNRYVVRPVKLGTQDADWVEVIEGLEAGESYVAKGSFAVKADIGKAAAEHED